MLFFGVCFFLYFIKLSAGNGFFLYKFLIQQIVKQLIKLRCMKPV